MLAMWMSRKEDVSTKSERNTRFFIPSRLSLKSILVKPNLKAMATGRNVVLTNSASEKPYSVLQSIPVTRMTERVQ